MAEAQLPSSKGVGRFMIFAAWLLFLALVTYFFRHVLGQRNDPNQSLAGSTNQIVVLKQNPSGHYLAPGQINSKPVRFLIDTGASSVAIPATVAAQLDLPTGVRGRAATANGDTLTRLTRARSISIGGISLNDVPVSVLPNASGGEVLLGMSFLKHLNISQQDGLLTLSRSAP